MKTLLTAFVLAIVPGFALAMGCSSQQHASMSCAEGSVYDNESGACVPVAS